VGCMPPPPSAIPAARPSPPSCACRRCARRVAAHSSRRPAAHRRTRGTQRPARRAAAPRGAGARCRAAGRGAARQAARGCGLRSRGLDSCSRPGGWRGRASSSATVASTRPGSSPRSGRCAAVGNDRRSRRAARPGVSGPRSVAAGGRGLRGKQLLDVVAHPQHRHAGVGDVGQNAGGRTYSHVAAEVEFRLLDGLQGWRLNAVAASVVEPTWRTVGVSRRPRATCGAGRGLRLRGPARRGPGVRPG
jgi:hypothetical protein